MTAHISDELPRLLTGEASQQSVQAASEHLRGCPDCQQDLVAAVVAHASLTSAQRFAPEIVRREIAARPQVEAAFGDNEPLPDLSAMFAQVRRESATSGSQPRSVARVPRRSLLIAAAAVIVAGAGTAGAIQLADSASTSHASVALAAFETGSAHGSASFHGDRLTVNASTLPALDATHRYEVWLTNDARTQMQPVGWIGSSGKADLTVPAPLARSFRDIEVSVQQIDSPSYAYSGTSVLRGSYSV